MLFISDAFKCDVNIIIEMWLVLGNVLLYIFAASGYVDVMHLLFSDCAGNMLRYVTRCSVPRLHPELNVDAWWCDVLAAITITNSYSRYFNYHPLFVLMSL